MTKGIDSANDPKRQVPRLAAIGAEMARRQDNPFTETPGDADNPEDLYVRRMLHWSTSALTT